MDLHRNPDLLDRLAAAYALGTLRGAARRRFETLCRQSPALRACALMWQERFASFTELQAQAQPSANVWKRIENVLAAERVPVRPADQPPSLLEPLRRRLGWWRGGALAGAVATAAAVVVAVDMNRDLRRTEGQLAQATQVRERLAGENTQLVSQLQSKPEIQYVAVLADDKSSASILVTFDPRKNTLTLKRVGGYQEGPDKSLELWALPPGAAPKSLGVLGNQPVVKLTAAESEVKEVPTLAISLEPRGGAPSGGGPTGPVLFKGALLQTPTT